MTWLALFNLLNTSVLTFAACVGAWTAFQGVNTWRKQLNWETNNGLSKSILMQLFKHRDAISTVRHPAIFRAEVEDAIGDMDQAALNAAEMRYLESAKVYEVRWTKITSVRSELYPLLLEARAVWGKEIDERIKPIVDLETELRVVVQTYLRAIDPGAHESLRAAASESLKEMRDILYDDFKDEDVFRADYDNAMAPLEEFLRKKLQSKGE